MKIRPCRNRMSRFVAAEMRYFHRPFAMSLLSCCTAIIALVSALLSLLSYVGSSSGEGAGTRGYLNLSVGSLIALFAAYIIYVIIKWGRLPSYSLVMSFTAVNYTVSAFAGFLLSRSVLYDMLEESIEGGYEYFLNNIIRWSFWAPAAIILLFFAASFVKSKTGNFNGGWWYIIFVFLPMSIIPFVSFVMRIDIEKENFVMVTSISVALYISIMLSIAARYIVKAIMNKFLTDMPVFEDAVVVKSSYRASDGKRIHWWEKKPPVSETDEVKKETVIAPASKTHAFGARFTAWFKHVFAPAAPPDVVKPDDFTSVFAANKTVEPSAKADAVPDDHTKSKDDAEKRQKDKQKAKEAVAKTKPDKQKKDKPQPDDTEQSDKIEKPDTDIKSKSNKHIKKPAKRKTKNTKEKAEPSTSSDIDVSAGGEASVPKSPKLFAVLSKLRAKNAKDSGKGNAKKSNKSVSEKPVPETENPSRTSAFVVVEIASTEQSPEEALETEKAENGGDEWFAESGEPANSEIADIESSNDEISSGELSDKDKVDSAAEPDNVADTEAENAAASDNADNAENAENKETPAEAEQETNVLLNRVVGALGVAIDNFETQNSAEKEDAKAAVDDIESESIAQNDSGDEQQPE